MTKTIHSIKEWLNRILENWAGAIVLVIATAIIGTASWALSTIYEVNGHLRDIDKTLSIKLDPLPVKLDSLHSNIGYIYYEINNLKFADSLINLRISYHINRR